MATCEGTESGPAKIIMQDLAGSELSHWFGGQYCSVSPIAIVDIGIVDIASMEDIADVSASFIEAWLSTGEDRAKLAATEESISPTTARIANDKQIGRHRFTRWPNTPRQPRKQVQTLRIALLAAGRDIPAKFRPGWRRAQKGADLIVGHRMQS